MNVIQEIHYDNAVYKILAILHGCQMLNKSRSRKFGRRAIYRFLLDQLVFVRIDSVVYSYLVCSHCDNMWMNNLSIKKLVIKRQCLYVCYGTKQNWFRVRTIDMPLSNYVIAMAEDVFTRLKTNPLIISMHTWTQQYQQYCHMDRKEKRPFPNHIPGLITSCLKMITNILIQGNFFIPPDVNIIF